MEHWICLVGREATEERSRILEALRGAGVDLRPQQPETCSGAGVLVVDEAGPATLDALRALRFEPSVRVLVLATTPSVISGGATWMLLRAGAADVLVWDGSAQAAASVAVRLERWRKVDQIIASPTVQNKVVGSAPTWLQVVRQIVEVAAFTDASVLILGESGTGKEEVARLLHDLDRRPTRAELVTLDCTTVVPELSGSEFFGHERGAFTGAVATRDGAFALANGGTLFLDEVGELPLPLQAQLLRAVQERSYKRVGGNTWYRTEFRLVCATNRDLPAEVNQGQFRRDFFHRIAAWVCRLPALRERPEDILLLVDRFLRQMRPDIAPELDPSVREYFLRRSYPGNIRDLRQLVGRICKRHVGSGPITAGDIPPDERPAEDATEWLDDCSFTQAVRRALSLGVGLKEISRAAADTAIRLTLAEEQGNLQRAAKRLGVTDRALQMRRAQKTEP